MPGNPEGRSGNSADAVGGGGRSKGIISLNRLIMHALCAKRSLMNRDEGTIRDQRLHLLTNAAAPERTRSKYTPPHARRLFRKIQSKAFRLGDYIREELINEGWGM